MSLFNDYTSLYVKVLLPLSLPKEYTYRIPQEYNEEIAVGKRVVVQFGKKRIYAALVIAIEEKPPEDYQAKYILSVLDSVPIVSEKHLDFWLWISRYYLCTAGEVMNAALPNGLKLQSETRIELNTQWDWSNMLLDDSEKTLVDLLRTAGSLSLDEVSDATKLKSSFKLVHSLYEKEVIVIREELQERYKPKIRKRLRFTPEYQSSKKQQELFDLLERGKTLQLHVVMRLISADPQNEGVPKSDFIKHNGLSPSSVKTLLKNKVLEEVEEVVERVVYQGVEEASNNQLTEEQHEVYEAINTWFDEKEVVLLHGVTSSGKTHVYIQLIEDCLKRGEQVLYLLPEISLTTQLIKRIQAYFGDKVMVNHSKFNNNERMEIWQKIKDNDAQILLAPRSGIFMPFNKLGLIIVDEEHENTFKQSEPSPRYQARDCSIVLGQIMKAKVLLGSATPSVESMHNARSGKYGFVHLTNRFSKVTPPGFEVVNMREEKKKKMNNGLFSSVLLNRIEQTMADGEQAILFLNRKGYVPITECNECSWSPRCIHCDITLTYYRKENRLRCHFCGYNIQPVSQCPACGNMAMKMVGYGTERVESELALIYPDIRIQRLDYETTRTKSAFENIISAFERKEIDVLVGTQMLTKGLDFESLSLVGILDADHALNFPDFRAFERSFQLFTQVGGRAGRRNKQGHVVIQANQPDHVIVQQVVDGNYDEFFDKEITEREKFHYPPFSRLIRITVKHKDYVHTEKASDMLALLIRDQLGSMMLGPEEPYITKIRGLFIRQILIKIAPPMSLTGVKKYLRAKLDIFKQNKDYRQVRVIVDVDP
ncbi:MAG: primosomal protein N' [Bacteroidia bacterium]|nr:primosomal protein N' [Bacteroidia bacterium]